MSVSARERMGQRRGHRRLVLVVGHDADENERIARRLRDHGFIAVVATTCLEAGAAMRALKVDALLGDLVLRDGPLVDLLRALAEERPSAVIGCTDGDPAPPEIDAAFARPIDLPAIAQFLDTWFGRMGSGVHPRLPPDDATKRARRKR